MTPPAAEQEEVPELNQVANLRHELLTPINHILGFTEMQIEEAAETGLFDCVPDFRKINIGGRMLLAIIEDGLNSGSGPSDLRRLGALLESQALPVLSLARKLAEQAHTLGNQSVAEEVDLVARALVALISISQNILRESGGPHAD
jgi:signal transduction histidine kinase